jgi:hypothetical protein
MSATDHYRGAIYEIEVHGARDEDWQHWFNGLAVKVTYASGQPATTILVGPVTDQAALRGMLCKLWDLNLTLISVRRLKVGDKEEVRNV